MNNTQLVSTDSIHRYQRLAPVYNIIARLFYHRYRALSSAALELARGQTVLDLACGTGLNLPFIQEGITGSGRVVAVDGSSAMLARAAKLAQRRGWKNVETVRADLATATGLSQMLGLRDAPVDAVLCTLGFSVIPHWQRVLERSYDHLKPKGHFVVMDCHFPRRSVMCRLVNAVAQADSSRRPWEELRKYGSKYRAEHYPFFGGSVFIARTTRDPAQ